MRLLRQRDFEAVAAALVNLTGQRWTVRRQALIFTRMPDGRLFYVRRDYGSWVGFTCRSMTFRGSDDLRCAGRVPDESMRLGEDHFEVDAMQVASLYERALLDPPPTIDRSREHWACIHLAADLGERARLQARFPR